MGAMKNIALEIENSSALSYMWHEIQAHQHKLEKIEAMLSEICHNLQSPEFVETCYMKRYEFYSEEST